jgi:ribonuclease VapC
VSAVNVSECCARGVERQASVEQVLEIIRSHDVEVVSFDLDDAFAAGRSRASTRSIGASSGDRACPALGQRHHVPVLTGDRRLAAIDSALGLDVRLIR